MPGEKKGLTLIPAGFTGVRVAMIHTSLGLQLGTDLFIQISKGPPLAGHMIPGLVEPVKLRAITYRAIAFQEIMCGVKPPSMSFRTQRSEVRTLNPMFARPGTQCVERLNSRRKGLSLEWGHDCEETLLDSFRLRRTAGGFGMTSRRAGAPCGCPCDWRRIKVRLPCHHSTPLNYCLQQTGWIDPILHHQPVLRVPMFVHSDSHYTL